jgi:Amt family ammonium transporter
MEVWSVWFLMGAALVFFMQAGFTMVEVGLARSKNTGNLVMKNLLDFCIGSLAFWVVGFGLMFGVGSGLIGRPDLFLAGDWETAWRAAGQIPEHIPGWTFLIFQTVFCATAATIISGSMAERTKFSAYCLYSLAMSMIVYPVSGHWVWGGGWLAELGFHDFAGSTAVHMVGGIAALVGAWILGPRIGKYDAQGKANAIPGQSLAMAALGVFILWFAWFGFNGCSTLGVEGDGLLAVGSIFVTTNLSAATGAIVAMAITWIRYRKPDVSMTLNGALGGLVGITAGCDAVTPSGAVAIGAISGVALTYGLEFVDKKLRIDDPVGAFGVHGLCGALGTVMVGLLAVDGGLLYGGGSHLLGVQALGVVSVAAWVAVAMGIVYMVIHKTVGLRVSAAEEIAGLDMEEHGILDYYPGFASGRFTLAKNGDAAARARTAMAPSGGSTGGQAGALPAGTARGSSGGSKLTRLQIVTRPERFADLKEAMHAIGITGMTVTKVMGCGVQRGTAEFYRGAEVATNLLPKLAVDIVVAKVPVRTVIETAKRVLQTGRIGDGKIFVYDVENAVKVRTGEEGYDALQYPE